MPGIVSQGVRVPSVTSVCRLIHLELVWLIQLVLGDQLEAVPQRIDSVLGVVVLELVVLDAPDELLTPGVHFEGIPHHGLMDDAHPLID